MFWYGAWGWAPWLIVPLLMCVGMVAMMLLMMRPGVRGPMGWCGGGHTGEARPDPALDTLRQRFASGELTRQEYEERRQVLLTVWAARPQADAADGERGADHREAMGA